MTLRSLVAISTLLPWMSCSEMPMASPDACNCAAPTAAQVSYSNSTSHLTSTNVQAAVDELAARPTATPLAMQVKLVSTNMNITSAMPSASANCPDPAHDLAIGGVCSDLGTGVTAIRGTYLDNRSPTDSGGPQASFGCGFAISQATQVSVTVSCLLNVR